MTTVNALVESTIQKLMGSFRTERNRLVESVSDVATTLKFEFDLQGITRGAYIGLGDEVLYVWRSERTARTATVQRAEFDTSPTAHPSGTMVDVNPRFPRPVVRQALLEEVRSWPQGLFAIETIEVATATGVRTFDLPFSSPPVWILEVLYRSRDRAEKWTRVRKTRLNRDAPIDEFPSGSSLTLMGNPRDARTLRVTAGVPFDLSSWEGSTELETEVGMPGSLFDVAVMGACWRLSNTREMLRTFVESQGDSRRAEEVPPGTSAGTSRLFEQIRDQRINEELARIRATYPFRSAE